MIDLQQSCIEDTPANIAINKSATLGVVLKDTKGQPISNASAAITAKVTLSSIDDDSLVTPIVLESGNGKYSVTFTPWRYIDHIVSVQVNGNHVNDSPVKLEVCHHAACNYVNVTSSYNTKPFPTRDKESSLWLSSFSKLTEDHANRPTGKKKSMFGNTHSIQQLATNYTFKRYS